MGQKTLWWLRHGYKSFLDLNTIEMLKKDYAFVTNKVRMLQMLLKVCWCLLVGGLIYAMEVVTSAIAADIAEAAHETT
jgi:hypothetical protein